MKSKFWKISSAIMAPVSLMMTIITATNHNWALMVAWGVTTIIWILNVKLYWND